MARHRADLDHPLVLADVGEVGEVVDVDQVRGLGEPQLHHRQQAVAAGDDPRLRAEPLERRDRALDAGRTFVLEWRGGLHGAPLLRQDCLAGNRLRGWPMSSRRSYCSGRFGADDRRARQLRGARLAARRVEGARRRAAVGGIAQRRAARAGGGDRRLAAEPRERQRAARVDLADPRRHDVRALREVAQALRGRARVEALDQAHGVGHPRLLDQQPLERGHAGVEVRVDVVDDSRRPARSSRRSRRRARSRGRARRRSCAAGRSSRRGSTRARARSGRPRGSSRRRRRSCAALASSSRITSSEPPYAATSSIVVLACCWVVSSSAVASRSAEPFAAVCGDRVDGRDDARGRVEHALEQHDHDREHDEDEQRRADPARRS